MLERALGFYRRNPLSLRILGSILAVSTLFATAVAGVQLYEQYREDLQGIESRLVDLERSVFPSLQDAMWKLDDSTIRLHVQAISHLPGVMFARVELEGGEVLNAGELKDEASVSIRRFEFTKAIPNGAEIPLGTLAVYLDMQAVYVGLVRKGLLIAGSQAIKTFAVSIGILLILHFMLMRHLATLAEYARATDVGNLRERLQLKRAKKEAPDELDRVAESIEQMRQRLAADIEKLEHAERVAHQLSVAVEASPVAIALLNLEGEIIYANSSFEQLSGVVSEQLQGINLLDGSQVKRLPVLAGHPAGDPASALREKGEWQGEVRHEIEQGVARWLYVRMSTVRDTRGMPLQYVVVMEDLTPIREFEERVAKETRLDSVTRLPNRQLALDDASRLLERTRTSGMNVAFVVIGITDYKPIVESYGLEYGDALLLACAERIAAVAPANAILSRSGEAEFMTCFETARAGNELELFIKRLSVDIARPLQLLDQTVSPGFHAGIALSPDNGEEPLTLYRNALTAERKATLERTRVQYFESSMNEAATRRLQIANLLKGASRRGEITVNYQPIVTAGSGRIASMEALVRWNSPELGFVPPPEFIGVAERTGDIQSLGKIILHEACRQTADWNAMGQDIAIAVNISPAQFLDDGFIGTVTNCVEATGLPAERLKLEITEQLLLEGSSRLRRKMEQLVRLGFQLSIDDFGTGYSSLSYLREYPFHFLKIDRAFVKDLDNANSQLTLCRAMVDLAHHLGMEVIAEGVETEAHVAILSELGCEYLQGYFFARPAPAEEHFRAGELAL